MTDIPEAVVAMPAIHTDPAYRRACSNVAKGVLDRLSLDDRARLECWANAEFWAGQTAALASAGVAGLVSALEASRDHIETLTADIGTRVYRREELSDPDAFVGIDDGKYDGTWASYRDQIDAALSSFREQKA